MIVDRYSFLVLVLSLMAAHPSRAETYSYDDAGRLTQVIFDDFSSITYTYDANGNILDQAVVGDDDEDGVIDSIDNCPGLKNAAQTNTDGDPQGDDCDADDDNDTMPDDYEIDNLLNPLNAADADADADLDGFSNLKEFEAGTDPNDPQSRPFVSPIPWLQLLFDE